jgi:GNAT superfamily N-acetyltransferase
MKAEITVSSPVTRSPRVLQVAGMFDVPLEARTSLSWSHELPVEDQPWHVGLITGPSGAGKTTLARELWPGQLAGRAAWSPDRALVDDFPAGMSIRDVTGLLSSVGLASPPAWLRPYATLSNGEAFRAAIARSLAEADGGLVVVDEFSSVVDRQVAKVASHAVARAVRRASRQFVAVTCHYDVTDWLQPDWVYDVAAAEFTWRRVQRHPQLELEVCPADRSLWRLFARHHYLTANLHKGSACFAGLVDGRPVGFASYLHFPHPQVRNLKVSHRAVVLPDWQGLGIGGAMADWLGAYLAGQGYRFRATTAHPARIAHYARSPRWRASPKRDRLTIGPGAKRSLQAKQLDPRRLMLRTFEYVPVRKNPASRPAE